MGLYTRYVIKKYTTDINNNIILKEENISYEKRIKKQKNIIEINDKEIVSHFLGFGSAITESSAFNYQKLNDKNKERFINDYYSSRGLNYSFGRISIGSNDFSLSSYQYSYKKDLSDFSIERDRQYIIPMLNDILNKKKISLIASPWSPPRMYKRLPILRWGIKLSKKYFDNYSKYLTIFLKEYKKNDINIDYITMQNEPIARQRWESCVYNINEQKEFIYQYLLPKLNDTKVLLWDHNKDNLFNIVNNLYKENDKIAGVGFHYYTGNCFNEIKKIHEKYPNLLLINTEMCAGFSKYNENNWIKDAEYYLKDIIGDINNGVNAYLDWNILLDEKGGPSHSKNYVKSACIRINNDYIKSPIYYYLYHISHFLGKSNLVLHNKVFIDKIKVLSLKCDNRLTILIMNSSDSCYDYSIKYNDTIINDGIKAHTVLTYTLENR